MHKLLYLTFVLASATLWGQETDIAPVMPVEGVAKSVDPNWHRVEIIVFIKPALLPEETNEDTNNETPPDNPEQEVQAEEKIWLHSRQNFPENLRSLTAIEGAEYSPRTVEQFSALLDSVEYAPIVRLVPMHSTPELEDISFWLENFGRYHGAQQSLDVIAQPDTLGQYWPYIEPLSLGLNGFGEQSDLNAPGAERLETLPYDESGEFIFTDGDEEAVVKIPADQAFRSVPSADFQLKSEARRIRNSGSYQLLIHESWQQPVPERGAGLSVLIQAAPDSADAVSADDALLKGTVKVESGRFLHAQVILWYANQQQQPPTHPPDFSEERVREDEAVTKEDEAAAKEQYAYLEMSTQTRLRTGELHYLDHPRLGALLIITPYEPDEI